MARKSAPVHVIVHHPNTAEGRHMLADRVAGVHADMVCQYISRLNCPSVQKDKLLHAVMETANKSAVTQTR